MKQGILGIDLGTSSVKLLLWYKDDTVVKAKEKYEGVGCEFWLKALLKALEKIDASAVSAVGLSSQVGTYIVDNKHIISWNAPEGREELEQLKAKFSADVFMREISMPHPNINSYPIPRLMYIKRHYQNFSIVCQPKDFLCKALTGNCVTDMYSWRGLANLHTSEYSDFFLDYMGIDKKQLPPIIQPAESAGGIILKETGIKEGTPVYIGCNDFFAALLGMGIRDDVFDITGTSEHIGVITKNIISDTKMVCGPYFTDNVHYGVTASSGTSMDFCLESFMPEVDIESCIKDNPPVFLPYINGERAPVWNANANGVFFGINNRCGKSHMAYSVMEGIVFSLYHIYENLKAERADSIIITGGGANNKTLSILKAEMFGIPVKTLEENNTSALGAVMLASVGCGLFKSLSISAGNMCKIKNIIYPCGSFRDILLKRFEIYKKIYPSLKHLFREKRNIN